MSALQGRNVVLGITGGISAYKGAELCRLLRKAGAAVQVVMTRAAAEFITPLTLQTLSGHPVAHDLFDLGQEAQIGHIRLADEADVVVVAPATADAIARFAAGMAGDLLSAVLLATRAPVVLAPAMNVNMWDNPITQANLARLLGTGRFTTVGPDAGELACGWIGAGRLVDPTELLAAVERLMAAGAAPGSLAGRKVVVTAGPTFEPLDDVRFLGNRSSGKMGFAVAAAAARLGAEVLLIAGPVVLPTPAKVARRIDVESAVEMQRALRPAAAAADVVVMAAAVADFRPASRVAGKLSRRGGGPGPLSLTANPDLLGELGRSRQDARPVLVGFAAEAGGDLIERARAKLAEKRCDVIAANDIAAAGLGFGSDRNALTLVFADGRVVPLSAAPKDTLAQALWVALLPIITAADAGRESGGTAGLGAP
jgi:phosphopantothenoylcysteine decarboxylase/phosphopantothenate--cysteine ligase